MDGVSGTDIYSGLTGKETRLNIAKMGISQKESSSNEAKEKATGSEQSDRFLNFKRQQTQYLRWRDDECVGVCP
jgi:hypothetical protein